MSISVRPLTVGDEPAWDDFIEAAPDGTFFHLSGWRRVLEDAFGHRTHFLLAESGSRIAGVLPLAEVKSVLFGHSLSSLPFCVYGGPVSASSDADEALRAAACELAASLRVEALELRSRAPSGSGWPTKDLYYTFRKSISPDDDANMKAIPNKQRAMVRKGIAAGLSSEFTDDNSRLYRVYSESVRNLGTPVFGRGYFDVLKRVFADKCSTMMVIEGGEDVAGVMSFYFREEVLPYYGGSVARARNIKGCNDFMYWELLRRSAADGYTTFDFGRSKKGTGPFSFKKNWGFTPEPLPYEYFLVTADKVPDINPMNPKYRLFVDNWKRLPLGLANRLGPMLARNLG